MESKHQENAKKLIREVVRAYRAKLGRRDRPLSFVRFANALNQHVSHLEISVSYQAVKNWEKGTHRPNFFFVQQLANHAPEGSWQHAFAMDLLAVQWPELYQPGSEIGERFCQKKNSL